MNPSAVTLFRLAVLCALGTAAVFVSQATFGEAVVLAAVSSGLGVYTLWWMEFRRGGIRP